MTTRIITGLLPGLNKFSPVGSIRVMLLFFVKGIEHLASRSAFLGRVYGGLFYRKMVTREAEMARLGPGMKVLHIGSGPLPLTALYLARGGCSVEAIDNDRAAVRAGARLVEKAGLAGKVRVQEVDGMQVGCGSYDAVWVSLHVFPRQRVIDNVLATLPVGGRLIYRNPRGWLARLYPRLDTTPRGFTCLQKKSRQALGKETVVLEKVTAA